VTLLRRGICTVLDPCRDIPMNDVRAHLSCLEYISRNTKDHHVVHLQYLDSLLIHDAEMRIKTENLIWKVTICEIGGVRAEPEKKKRQTEQRNELILITAWESWSCSSNLNITHPIMLIPSTLHPPHLHHNWHMAMNAHPFRIRTPCSQSRSPFVQYKRNGDARDRDETENA